MNNQGNKAFDQIKRVLVATQQRIEDVRTLIVSQDMAALVEAEDLIDQPLTLRHNSLNSVYTDTKMPKIHMSEIEDVLEELFQSVGREISKASEEAHRLGWKRRKNRRQTVDLLLAAGIRAVMRRGRNLSSNVPADDVKKVREQLEEEPRSEN
jgi:hypothetical protein